MRTEKDLYVVRRDGQEFRLKEMAADELETLEMLLMDDITAIKDSLAQANVNRISFGVYADADWYRRAQTARSIKARQLETVKRLRKEVSKQARAAVVPLAMYFMDAARSILRDDVFQTIYAEAEAIRDRTTGVRS